MPIVPKHFFERPTLELAEKLLGKIFVRRISDTIRLKGRIVETEAYCGEFDEASHAWRGKTTRNSMMFNSPGMLYVYLAYGSHYMLNIVSEPENIPGAVLIRAMEPIDGLMFMKEQRGTALATSLLSGPGKLTQAFAIRGDCNGKDLFNNEFFLENAQDIPQNAMGSGSRVGITKSRQLQWRKYILNNPHVSKARGS
ncbi:DNA-3-methyladenine glycosylase [Chlorobium phaeobacteroides]|uniref:Putative 3-methyladenine DNA glycosylase n=1 Tax=Chlorobium phaeobacteroides (strain DSM 266 / SMG 266 / 2430) TaxID=290317 RepID=3MGH_CHLPD|nr:DNA-3-methyladenine glycosylase [Chlorobium phaeobacteroides]A1BI83.1 RecName: Full=Putative 3-methyladenine DNA glycosylase [Chlorobium phaeobacteroides DSM 266]ABL66110.1 DNA-3-methyladenine glycosylase [Chlorobium phaeobacteroides DSM 266]